MAVPAWGGVRSTCCNCEGLTRLWFNQLLFFQIHHHWDINIINNEWQINALRSCYKTESRCWTGLYAYIRGCINRQLQMSFLCVWYHEQTVNACYTGGSCTQSWGYVNRLFMLGLKKKDDSLPFSDQLKILENKGNFFFYSQFCIFKQIC